MGDIEGHAGNVKGGLYVSRPRVAGRMRMSPNQQGGRALVYERGHVWKARWERPIGRAAYNASTTMTLRPRDALHKCPGRAQVCAPAWRRGCRAELSARGDMGHMVTFKLRAPRAS
jgi:hypothetical protein